jgi:acyl-coenzyme A synthetase/AMP-(fatty) acid ligase
VGQPAEGHDIRLIDEKGQEVPPRAAGEVVGRSPGMMTGYHRQPAKTAEAEWYDARASASSAPATSAASTPTASWCCSTAART